MPDILTAYAEGQPDKLAVIDDRPGGGLVTWTYAELEERSNKLGNALAALGAEPGQKVIWCGPNSPEIVKIMQATRKVGTVAVPLNYRLTVEEARYITAHSDSSIAYVDAEYAHLFAPEDEQSGFPGSLRHVIVFGGPAPDGMLSEDDLVAGASAEPPEEVQQGMGAATMIYTSGTTGKPKGAVRRFRDEASIIALITFIGYQTDDIYITSGPLYHSGPGSFMAIGLALGQTVVIQRKFDPEDWLRLVEKHKVTSTFSAPALVRMICALPAEVKAKYDRSSMKRMIANAAPWSFALKQAYLADFPDDSLWEVYGSTELGINCVLEPKDQLRKPGSCGKPAPMVEIMLVDADGKEVTGIGPDQSGELFVRSAQIFNEYYKQPDSYEKARRGEYHTVGDIAYRDEEGFYFICDRKNDMIISGGMNIYPAEIEAALEQHPKIYDVAVFGIPSEEWGELVHATIVVAPDAELTETEVIEFSRQHLAGYKTPRSVAFTEELPRTGSGKILKRELRAPYWQGRTANV
ncbi:MAG TPA: AMP-binding protein [Streptosporangiaceae bacterium]|jgi:acyl-CoA synthetase (AMP-forming)/AMP-acid ligase II|nr:AMP-binding protein [Streptosporangiaceae bacterium]